MIARRSRTRQRRSDVLERLARVTGKTWRTRAQGHDATSADEQEARVERLSRALVDLGPAFAAYGLYLSSRGDLLAPADRRYIAEIGRGVPPLTPAEVRAIVSIETDRSTASVGQSAVPGDPIASLDAEPFDTRLVVQRHHGRLASGRPVVVRIVRPDRSSESDLEWIPLLRDAVAPLLTDGRLFSQSVDDFRASYLAQTNGLALADALVILGHDARGLGSLRVPEVYRAISTPRVLVLERLPGRRLSAPLAEDRRPTARDDENAEEGDEARRARGDRDGPARILSEVWLRQAFDGGLVPTDLSTDDVIVSSRSQVAIDEGTFAVLPIETRKNLMSYLVAVAIDEPRKALDCLLREFEATRHRAPLDQLDRLFRQMVPDLDRDGPSDGPTGRLAATVLAQWRLAIENGYRPLRPALPLLRGLARLDETVGVLAPGRDALLEGLKDFRVERLLGDVHTLLEPMYWFGRFDKIATLLMTSPRILDDAIAAAAPDRAAEERNVAAPCGRPARAGHWLVPALAALALVGLTSEGGPSGAGGPRHELFAAILFLLLGRWLLRSVDDPDR